MKEIDVLIIGAGPVGLFCANEALRHGLSCRIIDKKTGLSNHSKALGIHIRSLDLLSDCGFLEEVLKQGHQVEGVTFKADGKEIVNANFSEIQASRHYLIDLPQNKTESILYQGLLNKSIEVEWKTELTDLIQTPESITATIQKPNGNNKTIHAKWLIACDGAHSTVRHLLNAPFVGAKYQKNWWLADLHVHWMVPENRMAIYMSKHGPLACFPMGEKRYRLVMTAPEGHTAEPSFHDIKEAFTERSTDLAQLDEPIWLSQFSIHHRQIDQYRHDRIFFAGDAAHIHSPMGGQGLNTGLQDVYNLIWKLALVEHHEANPDILNTYQIERHPVGAAVLKKTDEMTKMILLTNKYAIRLRNAFIKLLLSMKNIRKAIIRDLAELTISYAKSPIVEHHGKIKSFIPGAFCPEFHLFNPITQSIEASDQLLQGKQHHLLIFSGPNEKLEERHLQLAKTLFKKYKDILKIHLILSHPDPELNWRGQVWHDEGLVMFNKHQIKKPSLVLVRPDKYIGLVQQPIQEKQLFSYFQKWLPRRL